MTTEDEARLLFRQEMDRQIARALGLPPSLVGAVAERQNAAQAVLTKDVLLREMARTLLLPRLAARGHAMGPWVRRDIGGGWDGVSTHCRNDRPGHICAVWAYQPDEGESLYVHGLEETCPTTPGPRSSPRRCPMPPPRPCAVCGRALTGPARPLLSQMITPAGDGAWRTEHAHYACVRLLEDEEAALADQPGSESADDDDG